MIRVLHFARVINRHDFIDVIIQNLDRARFAVAVCVGTDECNIATPTFPAGTQRFVIRWRKRIGIAWAALRLAMHLRHLKIDILHTHHYDEALIGWLATRIHPATRLVVGRHYSEAIYYSSTGLKRRILLQLEHLANAAATKLIVPSSVIADILSRRQNVDPEKIIVIPYGFVKDKYTLPHVKVLSQMKCALGTIDRIAIGTFGRLDPGKGHRYLIDAMPYVISKCPNATLLIVGEGPERGRLEAQISKLGLDTCIRLLGWRTDVIEVMSVVDIVVQPTLHEAFSQVMAEAMWMKRALVITRVSGATDLIVSGENGLLVDTEDSAALGYAINRLAGDAELRESMGEKALVHIENNLSAEVVIPLYESAYIKAMNVE